MPVLTGEKCRLRPLASTDQAVTIAWRRDIETTLGVMGYRFPVTEAGEAAWYADVMNDRSQRRASFAISPLASDEPLGLIHLSGIDWISRVGELGIVVAPEARGRGFGADACRLLLRYGFDVLNLNRIWLRVGESNAAAIAAYERAGFKSEGTLRAAHYAVGAYHDVRVMGALAGER